MHEDVKFLRRLFSDKDPTGRTLGTTHGRRPFDPRLEPLALALFAAVMQASKQIGEGWTQVTGEHEMPFISNWAMRVEELGFFLHLAYRLVFIAAGDEARARLQDYLTMHMVNELVDSSFDSSNVEPSRKGELAGKMKLEVLDVINDTEMEYAECDTWLKRPPDLDLTASLFVWAPDDTDITGRLAKRIAEDTRQADTKEFRQLIWGCNISACNDLSVIGQVDIALQTIRS